MKRLILIAATTLAANIWAGTGATTNWVAQYVREYVSNALSNSTATIAAEANVTSETNGTTTTTLQAGGFEIGFNFEPLGQPALIAQECSTYAEADGVTNGYLWAWSDQENRYVNVSGFPIIPTTTNFTYKGVSSVEQGGKTYLKTAGGANYCEVKFTQIQKTTADKLKGAN